MSKEYTPDDIQALSGGEHVRMRPEMYFEKCFKENSLDSLPFEMLCHAFDEYFDGNCNKITFTIWKDSFSINYNTGMALRAVRNNDLSYAEMIMTKLMACSNLKKHLAVGQEFCSIGIATVNLACDSCKLTTVWENKKGIFEFEDGETKTKSIEAFESEDSWTEIHVRPNKELFKNLAFTFTGVAKKAQEINHRLTGLIIVSEDKTQ